MRKEPIRGVRAVSAIVSGNYTGIVSLFKRRKTASVKDTGSITKPSPGMRLYNYELVKLLGEGAYSRVWLGRNDKGDYVAIKVIKPVSGEFLSQRELMILSEEVRRAFEVSYARLLSHSSSIFSHNVVKVLDINMRPVLRYLSGERPYEGASEYRRDPPYLVMEYVSGGSIIDNRRIILASPKMFLCTVKQMVGAVKFVTEALRERIHGDVKPDNILVRAGERLPVPVLTDFGTSINITWEGWLLGTPEYMPPEGLLYPSSSAITSSYDTYSLGLTIYELLTGEIPSTQSLLIAVSRHPLLGSERRSPHITRLSGSFDEPPGQLITAAERVIYSEQLPQRDEIIHRLKALEDELNEGSLKYLRVHDLSVLEEAVSKARQPEETKDLIKDLIRISPTQRPALDVLLKYVDNILSRYNIKCVDIE